jgi:acetylornithine deacetylase
MSAASLDEAIAWLERLVAMRTVSGTPLVRDLEQIGQYLASLGAEVEIFPAGDTRFANLVAHFGEARRDGVAWAGHLDVVPADADGWSSDPFNLAVRGDSLVGRGAVDMKGFLACVLASAGQFATQAREPQTIIVTYEEETTMDGAREVPQQLRTLGLEPRLLVVGEPTDLIPCTAHPGVLDVDSRFEGIAGHGADRENTASAVVAASAFVSTLEAAQTEDVTFNPGILAGGTARNVVAAECNLTWELRYRGAFDAKGMLAGHRTPPPVTRHDTIVSDLPAFVASDEAKAQTLLLLGDDTDLFSDLPFVTEAGIYAQAGLPTIVCGPGDWQRAHQIDEYILSSELSACLELIGKQAA